MHNLSDKVALERMEYSGRRWALDIQSSIRLRAISAGVQTFFRKVRAAAQVWRNATSVQIGSPGVKRPPCCGIVGIAPAGSRAPKAVPFSPFAPRSTWASNNVY